MTEKTNTKFNIVQNTLVTLEMTENDTEKDREPFIFDQLFRWLDLFEFPIPADPLSTKLASEDSEVLRLRVDPDHYRRASCIGICIATIFCPCFFPLFVLQGLDCIAFTLLRLRDTYSMILPTQDSSFFEKNHSSIELRRILHKQLTRPKDVVDLL